MNYEIMSNKVGVETRHFFESFGIGVEEFQQSIIDFCPDIIYVYDLDQEKLVYNTDKISRVLGFSDDNLKEWDYDLMKLVYADDTADVLKELGKCHDLEGEATHSYQCRFNRKSGGWLKANVIGKVIKRNSIGRPSLLLFIAQDISSQVIAADKLRAIDELKSSVTNLEEFTQIASHDIQEPLRRIATFSERMKSKFAADLNGEAMGYLDRIMRTSKSAHLLIDGLRDFLQLDHKHLHFVTTDLNVLLAEVNDELELQIEELKATITWENLPRVEVIPQQIKQLFTNLISNALKFRKPERAIVISINARRVNAADTLSYVLNPLLDYFEITVRDNGIGFNVAATEKMFQMFHRFHSKSTYPGAGIGLAICRKIADKHRGVIMASSVPDEGAVFSIILPVNQMKRE